jgi:AMMECR1 domain-containing protein
MGIGCHSSFAADLQVAEKEKHQIAANPSLTATAKLELRELPEQMDPKDIAVETMAIYFGQRKGMSFENLAKHARVPSTFRKPAGVFVTLSSRGKTRACWGSIYPQSDSIAKSTVYATLGALTKEYRYAPIKAREWQKLQAQVTVIKEVEPISSFREVNPLRDGLIVRSGGKSGVLLPGEAVDAHYQLVACKLKAGIKPKEPCQLYRLRTEIYE